MESSDDENIFVVSKEESHGSDLEADDKEEIINDKKRKSSDNFHSFKLTKKPNIKKNKEEYEGDWTKYLDTNPSLDRIAKMVLEVSTTTSRNEKIEILKKYPDCVKIHLYTNNPFWQYYISSTRVRKTMSNMDIRCQAKYVKDIFDLLDILKERKITGNIALATVCNFIANNKKYDKIIYSIIDKNLKIRCGTATINKVFPNLIPEFPVALAEKIEDIPNGYLNLEKDTWFALRKFDGVRVICFIKNGVAEFRSRQGNIFVTLLILEKMFNTLKLEKDLVIDGELCIFENGKENFKKAVSEIKRKSGMIMNPRYVVFDMLTPKEFESKESVKKYSERMAELRRFVEENKLMTNISVAECIQIKDEKHLQKLKETASKKEWEGLILRKDEIYEGKRSNNMIKVKKFKDGEYECIDLQTGKMRFIINGKDKEIETMSRITIDYHGFPVDVGTGFSLEERNMYAKNPDLIVGKVVCISYLEESKDKDGKPSLRFPSFKGIYGDDRTV